MSCSEVQDRYAQILKVIPYQVMESLKPDLDKAGFDEDKKSVCTRAINLYQGGSLNLLQAALRMNSSVNYELPELKVTFKKPFEISRLMSRSYTMANLRDMPLERDLLPSKSAIGDFISVAHQEDYVPDEFLPDHLKGEKIPFRYFGTNNVDPRMKDVFKHIIGRVGGVEKFKSDFRKAYDAYAESVINLAKKIEGGDTDGVREIEKVLKLHGELEEEMLGDTVGELPYATPNMIFLRKIESYFDDIYVRVEESVTKSLLKYSNAGNPRVYMAALDEMMDKIPLKEPLITYRGMKVDRKNPEFKVGDTFKDDGYMSTSVHPGIAESFATGGYRYEEERSVLLVFNMKKGTPAIAASENVHYQLEYEILVKHGTEFVVTKVEKRDDKEIVYLTNKGGA